MPKVSYVHPDGSRVPVELGLATHVAGDQVFALVFMRDLRERRSMQARLLEADRLATVGALCSGLAHEINNPLTYVVLHLSSLRRSLDKWIPEPAARGCFEVFEGGVFDVAVEAFDGGAHGPVPARPLG